MSKMNNTPTLKDRCRKISDAWYFHYVNNISESCYQYDPEGCRYIAQQYMIPIEKKVERIYIECLENEANYPMPPQ